VRVLWDREFVLLLFCGDQFRPPDITRPCKLRRPPFFFVAFCRRRRARLRSSICRFFSRARWSVFYQKKRISFAHRDLKRCSFSFLIVWGLTLRAVFCAFAFPAILVCLPWSAMLQVLSYVHRLLEVFFPSTAGLLRSLTAQVFFGPMTSPVRTAHRDPRGESGAPSSRLNC